MYPSCSHLNRLQATRFYGTGVSKQTYELGMCLQNVHYRKPQRENSILIETLPRVNTVVIAFKKDMNSWNGFTRIEKTKKGDQSNIGSCDWRAEWSILCYNHN